jgi:hypothetical protein
MRKSGPPVVDVPSDELMESLHYPHDYAPSTRQPCCVDGHVANDIGSNGRRGMNLVLVGIFVRRFQQ